MTKHRGPRRAHRHRGVKVLRLADGRRVARWVHPVSGRQEQQSLDALRLTNDTQRQAWAVQKAEQLAQLKRAVALGTVEVSRTTPRKAVDAFLETIPHPPTRASKRVVLEAWLAWCAEVHVGEMSDLSGPRLMPWRDFVLRPSRGHAPLTRNHWLAVTRHFLRWSAKRGLVPMLTDDVIRGACEAVPTPTHAPEILRPDALRNVLQSALAHDERPGRPREIAPLVLLLLTGGFRITEAVELVWEEVDFVDGAVRLPAPRTKTRTARSIPWRETPSMGLLLRALHERAGCPSKGRVFPELTGPAWMSACRRLTEKHGAPPFTAHTLRRTCGSVLVCAPGVFAGAGVYLVARRLGHSVRVAERAYLGVMHGLPREAKTLEAAAGIEDLAEQVVARVRGNR